jgi:hypothetical protein
MHGQLDNYFAATLPLSLDGVFSYIEGMPSWVIYNEFLLFGKEKTN